MSVFGSGGGPLPRHWLAWFLKPWAGNSPVAACSRDGVQHSLNCARPPKHANLSSTRLIHLIVVSHNPKPPSSLSSPCKHSSSSQPSSSFHPLFTPGQYQITKPSHPANQTRSQTPCQLASPKKQYLHYLASALH